MEKGRNGGKGVKPNDGEHNAKEKQQDTDRIFQQLKNKNMHQKNKKMQ